MVLMVKVPKGDAEEAEEPCFSLLKAKKALSEENIPIGKKLSEEAFYAGLKVTAEQPILRKRCRSNFKDAGKHFKAVDEGT